MILAISLLSAPSQTLRVGISAPEHLASARFSRANELYHSARRAAAFTDTMSEGRGDVTLVVADLLTARFLVLVRRANDALPILGSAIFRAQTCGLHRHESIIPGLTEVEAQERRLLWRYAKQIGDTGYLLNEPQLRVPLGPLSRFALG